MSEVEKSFTFLQDNIPQWLQDIAQIEAKVVAMQDEIARAPVSVPEFAKHKSDSTESIRPGRIGAIVREATQSQGAHDSVGSRKRKTISVLSGRASGPSRYRPRTIVVVHYDGDLQKSFELLVRAIGTGRNLLRKAKMEAKMNELAALASSSEDEDEVNDDDEEETAKAKISYRPRLSLMRVRAATTTSGGLIVPVELFDTTDKILERAQGLVESAAHLTLRDGDCREELKGVRKNFQDVLETAKAEATKCSARRRLERTALQSQDTPDASVSAFVPSYKKHFAQVSVPQPEPEPQSKTTLPAAPTVTTLARPKMIEIEVDEDEEDDEEEFVMPPVRLTSRFGARV